MYTPQMELLSRAHMDDMQRQAETRRRNQPQNPDPSEPRSAQNLRQRAASATRTLWPGNHDDRMPYTEPRTLSS
jgi:hypothetical protein